MYKSKYVKKIGRRSLPYTPSSETSGLDEPVEIVTQADDDWLNKSNHNYSTLSSMRGYTASAVCTGMSLRGYEK